MWSRIVGMQVNSAEDFVWWSWEEESFSIVPAVVQRVFRQGGKQRNGELMRRIHTVGQAERQTGEQNMTHVVNERSGWSTDWMTG